MYKEISFAPCLERLLQGKGSIKYAYKDSYKKKTSKPMKICQPSTTIKVPILSLTKVRIIYPSSGTLRVVKSSNLTTERYLVGTTSMLSVGSSIFVLCRYCFEHEDRVTYC